jgi:putative protease
MKKPEILSPAGNMEKLILACKFGSDAVYCAGPKFGLRESAGNFMNEELIKAVSYIRDIKKKIYITANIFPYNRDLKPMAEYFGFLNELNVDGIIISDLGAFELAVKHAPKIPLHISVQANNLNYAEVLAWQRLGAKRIILARELSFGDIKEIRERCPDMELEIFVHGAICVSYSGRCLISQYMTGRDANHGDCSQGCRWSYKLVEEKRPGQYMDIEEDARGTYLFNSKDLCTIRELYKFIDIGIDSFKIEGRMKSLHYAAVTAGAYSKAVLQYMNEKENYKFDETLYTELLKVSHREFTDGFYFPDKESTQNTKSSDYTASSKYTGLVKKFSKTDNDTFRLLIDVKNTIKINDELEMLTPSWRRFNVKVVSIAEIDGTQQTHTKHFNDYEITIESAEIPEEHSVLRVMEK